mmetsp:Transcript_5014/g.11967  ORF Transcript_5014/g.11967 Transcript_5014/m.11967 type:complete len:248 (-) Transcript_5014:288-1031(-)
MNCAIFIHSSRNGWVGVQQFWSQSMLLNAAAKFARLTSARVSLAFGIVQPLEQVNSLDTLVERSVLGETSDGDDVFRCVGLSRFKLDSLVTRAGVIIVKVDIDRHSLETSGDTVKGDITVHQFGLLDELAETIAVVLATKNTCGAVSDQDLSSSIALEFEASDLLSSASSPAPDNGLILKLVLAVVFHQTTRRVGFVDQVAGTSLDGLFGSSVGQSLLQSWGSSRAVVDNGGIRISNVFGILILGND